MCGIVGLQFLDRQQHVAPESIRAMCDAIIHRGPDDAGLLTDGNVGMGMRRLSIVDLAGGHQPIYNEDNTVAVVYNGEIYNYRELRQELESLGHQFRTRSDTEILVHGYEAWGDDLPRRLNGIFAFSIWDSNRRRLVLARDHIGVKPLYVLEDGSRIAWASEIKALLRLPGVQRELDQGALFDFLRFGYVPAPRTMFRGIRKLDPATIMTIENGRISQKKYWDVAFSETHNGEDWCERLRDLLNDAVQRQLMSDVPLGAFLSGGLDSSSIVATMHRLGVQDISTYAIGFGGKDAYHSELEKAALIAKKFETNHHEIVVEPNVADLMQPLIYHLDEPLTDTSFIVTYLVSKLASESVKVILSGVGGDEIFAGYRRYMGPQLQQLYRHLPGVVRRGMVLPIVNRLPVDRGSTLKSLFRYARGFANNAELPQSDSYQGYVCVFNGERSSVLCPELSQLEDQYPSRQVAEYYDSAPTGHALNRMLYADLKTSLVDSLLSFTDKMSMAVSLEARVPLLDYRLVELAARIPPDLKLHGYQGLKHIFKSAIRDRLPEQILHQKKQGFGTPISRWFRDSLRPMLGDLLSADRVRQRGYFRPAAVERLIDDHMAQRADYSEHLLALLTFEIWHQTFLDSSTN